MESNITPAQVSFMEKLGGEQAVRFLADKLLEFMQSTPDERAVLESAVGSYNINSCAKEYLLARYEDVKPLLC